MRQGETFIHLHGQGQRVGPYLHPSRSQSIGGLPWIAPLPPFVALLTVPDGNIEAPPNGLAHDFVLILWIGALEFHSSPAATPLGQGHVDDFVDLPRRLFAGSLAIRGARLPPGGFRMLLSMTAGEGSRLSLVGSLGFLQLEFQVVVFFSQALLFTLQPLSFTSQLLVLIP